MDKNRSRRLIPGDVIELFQEWPCNPHDGPVLYEKKSNLFIIGIITSVSAEHLFELCTVMSNNQIDMIPHWWLILNGKIVIEGDVHERCTRLTTM